MYQMPKTLKLIKSYSIDEVQWEGVRKNKAALSLHLRSPAGSRFEIQLCCLEERIS